MKKGTIIALLVAMLTAYIHMNVYSVRINGFGTWSREDDEIIRVKETK